VSETRFPWRRLPPAPLDGSLPHPTTLMKTTRCGAAAVDGRNEALLVKATEAKVLRTTTLRADTTVVPCPTDSGLLAKANRRIAATGKRILRRRWSDSHPGAGPVPCGGQAGPLDRGQGLSSRGAAGRDEALAVVRHTTGAGRPGRDPSDRSRTAAGHREQALRRARTKAAAQKAQGEHDAAAGPRRGSLARAIDDPRGPGHGDPADHRADPTAAGLRSEPPGGSACTTPTHGR